MASPGKLKCSFRPGSSGNVDSVLWFRPNQGKRSSFLLDLGSSKGSDGNDSPSYHAIPESPCDCYVEYVMNKNGDSADLDKSDFFFLGGFTVISTARSIEVHVIKQQATGANKEGQHVMTCRGIPVKDQSPDIPEACYKAFCVLPGGVRPVSQLRLKLISETTETNALVSIQLTGRIPDPQQQQHQQQTPQAQITPSSAVMLQQMMAASTPYNNAYSASTPLASGSSQRNPFFSPPSSDPRSSSRPPTGIMNMTPPLASIQGQTPPSSGSSLNGRDGTLTPKVAFPSSNDNTTEAVIAGVSFLVRSEGQATVKLLQHEIQKNQNASESRFKSMEQKLQQQQSMMETMMQQQQVMVQKQFEFMSLLHKQQQQQQLQWATLLNLQQSSHAISRDENNNNIAEQVNSRTPPRSPLTMSESNFPTESIYDPSCRVKISDLPESVTSKAALIEARRKEVSVSESTNPSDAKDPLATSSQVGGEKTTKNANSEDDTEGEKENTESNTEDPNPDSSAHNRHDDDSNDDASGLEEASGAGGANGSEDRSKSNDDSRGDNNNEPGDADRGCNENTKQSAEADAHRKHDKNGQYVESRFLRGEQFKDAIVEKQLVFTASRKGVFPGKASLERIGSGSCGVYRREQEDRELAPWCESTSEMDDYVESSYRSSPTTGIERKSSMVDHLSIRYCNTGCTGLPSLSSGEGSTQTNINQAESIEILAVFPTSLSTGSSSQLDSDGVDGEDLSSCSSEEEYEGSSVDEDDLVSVSLIYDENEEPPRPKHAPGGPDSTSRRQNSSYRERVFY